MNDQYSVNDHQIVFQSDYEEFVVVGPDGTASTPYDLTGGQITIQVIEGDYVITDDACNSCALTVVSLSGTNDSFSISQAKASGIGTIDIRDMARTVSEVEFDLELCPITISFNPNFPVLGAAMEVLSPCDQVSGCTEPNPGCRTVLNN